MRHTCRSDRRGCRTACLLRDEPSLAHGLRIEILDRAHRDYAGDGMFVNQLSRLARAVEEDRKGIEPTNITAKLHPADEIDHDADIFLANLVEKGILKVKLRFVHRIMPSSFASP